MQLTRPFLGCLIALLLILNVAAALALSAQRGPTLSVSFLDVGQGDAVLIESPTGVQVLIDGGKDQSAVRELGRLLGPLDRSLDLVVETHPDADHIGGLPDVFSRYRVSAYLSSDIAHDTQDDLALERAVVAEGLATITPKRGMRIHIGGEAYLDVLYPDRDVSTVETNEGSTIIKVVYQDTSFLLSGDASSDIEAYLVYLDGTELQSDVLKAGHHGSRTSSSEVFLDAVQPSYVVISAGLDNSYGHPHAEVVERIAARNIPMLETAKEGALTFVTDGKTLLYK